MFHELATSYTDDVDHLKGRAFSGWRNTHKLAFMGAFPGATNYYHLVSFGNHVVNRDLEVREGAAKYIGLLFEGFTTRRYTGWKFFVLNEIGRHQLIDRTNVSPIEDFLH